MFVQYFSFKALISLVPPGALVAGASSPCHMSDSGSTDFWTMSYVDVPASKRVSYKIFTAEEFLDEYKIWPQQAGLSPFPFPGSPKYYAIPHDFVVTKDEVERAWRHVKGALPPPLTFDKGFALLAEWDAAERRAGAGPGR